MVYYKVRKEFDNATPCRIVKSVFQETGKMELCDRFLVGDELFTTSEFQKYFDGYTRIINPQTRKMVYLSDAFYPVSIFRSKTYFFFGARFADEED